MRDKIQALLPEGITCRKLTETQGDPIYTVTISNEERSTTFELPHVFDDGMIKEALETALPILDIPHTDRVRTPVIGSGVGQQTTNQEPDSIAKQDKP